ncbi:MAG TPA: hypothetical protein HA232_04845 [Methanocellales archaeon]|nr:hypothetical protein [Methanocellales archaeon]
MIIHSLHVKDFCGLDDVSIEPLEKGVTLIEGPNEAGKSCLARALYIVLDELDSSNSRPIKSIQPINRDVGPIIEADIETGDYRFTIKKQFLKNNATVLNVLKPKPETLRGRDAHNKVQDILNETLDVALWKALNIIQGEDAKAIPANSSLSTALNQASGESSVGERELNLYDLVKAENERYYTSNKPAKELKTAKKELDGLQNKVDEISKEYNNAEKLVEDHARIAQEIQEQVSQKGRLEKERIERKQTLDLISGLQNDVKLEEEKERRERSEYDVLQRDFTARKDLIKDLDETEREFSKLQNKGDLDASVASAKDRLEIAIEELKRVETNVHDARGRKELYHRSQDYFNSCLWLKQLKERKEWIDTARKAAATHSLSLKTNTVDNDVLDEIIKASTKAESANNQLNEHLPSVKVRSERSLDVIIEGEPVSLEPDEILERTVPDELNLIIPDLLEVRISSGISPEKLKKKQKETQDNLEILLNKNGVSDRDGAIRANRDWHKADSGILQCQKIEQDNLFDLKYEEMVQKIHEAELKVESYEAEPQGDVARPSDEGEASTLLKEASTLLESEEEALEGARSAFDERTDKLNALIQKNLQMKSEISVAESKAETLAKRLSSQREIITDEQLANDLEEKKKQFKSQSEALRLKSAELAKYDEGLLKKAYEIAEEALSSFEDRLNEQKRRLGEIKVRIEVQEEQGVFEKMNQAKSELEQARKEYDVVCRNAEATSLLFEIMEDERLQVQTAYVNPLKVKIESLGRFIFGDTFQVDLDSELNIVSRTMNGLTIPFKSLSTGAKEQIGLITKLACAMTVSKDDGVPLVIDDALGHTDSSRINSMATTIGIAGNDCQILLLTCQPNRYLEIGKVKTISLS